MDTTVSTSLLSVEMFSRSIDLTCITILVTEEQWWYRFQKMLVSTYRE